MDYNVRSICVVYNFLKYPFWRRNPTTNNMCSKCFRDTQMNAERKASNSKAAIAALSDVHSLPEVLGAVPASSATQTQLHSVQKKHNVVEGKPLEIVSKSDEPKKVEANVQQSDGGLFERPAQKPGRCFTCNKKVRSYSWCKPALVRGAHGALSTAWDLPWGSSVVFPSDQCQTWPANCSWPMSQVVVD